MADNKDASGVENADNIVSQDLEGQASKVSDVDVSENTEPKKDTVAYETYQKLLGQRKADQKRLSEMQAQLDQVAKEKKAADEARLKEEGKTAELLALREQELQEIKDREANTRKQMATALKKQAIERELGGVKRPEFLNFADIDSIHFDDEGQIDTNSLKTVADKFRQDYSDLLVARKAPASSEAPVPPFSKPPLDPKAELQGAVSGFLKAKGARI